MSVPRQAIRGLRALLEPHRADEDVADEVADYVERATLAHIERGLAPEAARRAALKEIGSAFVIHEQVRTSGWEYWIETTLQDMRYAFRGLRRSPDFSLTAVATLALGIGASTAVYSAVRPILLEPLPFPHAERLVSLDDRASDGTPMPSTLGTYQELRARAHAFEALAAADRWQPSLSGVGDPERLEGQAVTWEYFGVFGAPPLRGRGFAPDDDVPGAPRVVMVSQGLAERRFGGTGEIVGRSIQLDGDLSLVIGVMPKPFENILAPNTDIWRPLRERATGDHDTRSWGHHYRLVGRLAPTSLPPEASREILAIGQSPRPEFSRPPWASLKQGMHVRPLGEAVTGGVRPALVAIVASVLLLLAIASVNVANLLLARGAQRQAEFAMRLTLGAGRLRLLRQLLTESVTLALVGGVLGLGVAEAGVRALVAISPPGLPRVEAIRLEVPVFIFALALTTCVGAFVGLIPAIGALRASRAGLQNQSRRTIAGPGGARSVLVVAEFALAIVLLVSAGLLFRSGRSLMSVPTGFDPSHVVTLQVVQAGHGFASDVSRLQFYDQTLEAVRRLPGVVSVAFTSRLPLAGEAGETDEYGYQAQSRPDMQPGEGGSAVRYAVTPPYLAAMRIPLVRGRWLEATDQRGGRGVAVINESLARRLFGNRDPIGQQMRFGPAIGSGEPWREVVGVVGDVRHYSLALAAPDAFYVPTVQWSWVDPVATLVVRTTGDPKALIPSLERAIWSVNSAVPIPRVGTMEGYVDASAGDRHFVLLVIEAFATAALLLAAIGLYGVISGSVTEQHREIGIRAALGATPDTIMAGVVRAALGLALVGAILGVLGAAAATRLIESMLFGISALDPLTYGAVIGLLTLVAFLAAWAPARRAAEVDPVIALRAD